MSQTTLTPEPEQNPDEIIVEYLDGEFCGWQLENTILSASVHGYQAKVASGKSRPCWMITDLTRSGRTLKRRIVWERPRIDIEPHILT